MLFRSASTNYPANIYKFRQDSTFLYYAGINDPDMALVLDTQTGEQILFGNDVDIDDIIWMGPQPSIKEKGEKVGITTTKPFNELINTIKNAKSKGRQVHYIPPYRNHNKILLSALLEIPIPKLKENASLELIKAIVDQRIVKEECEIQEIDKACNIGYTMHYIGMQMAKPGVREQEIVGVMEGIALADGAMTSFPIICSQNGETLHNHMHHQILTEGRLLLIDAGAETNMNYCSDFTRTLPCSGKFTQQQKDIYNIVATANNYAVVASRPGITYNAVHLGSCKLLAQGLINLGLMKGNVEEAVAAGSHALFQPHGLGHNIDRMSTRLNSSHIQ